MRFEFRGSVYELITSPLLWSEAQTLAQSRGGYLAVIDSAEENRALFEWLLSLNPGNWPRADDGGGAVYVWLGGHDKAREGHWQWVDGRAMGGAYTNWGNGEPDDFAGNQDALALGLTVWPYPEGGIGLPGQWNDVAEDNRLYALIEFRAGSPSGGSGGSPGGTPTPQVQLTYSSSYSELAQLAKLISAQPRANEFWQNAFTALHHYELTPTRAVLYYQLGDLSWQEVLEGSFQGNGSSVSGIITNDVIYFNGQPVLSRTGSFSVEDFIRSNGWLAANQLLGNEEDNVLFFGGESLISGGPGRDYIFLRPQANAREVTVYTGPGPDILVLDLALGGEGVVYHFPDFTPGEDKIILGGPQNLLARSLAGIEEDASGFSAAFRNGTYLNFGIPWSAFDLNDLFTPDDGTGWIQELFPVATAFDWSHDFLWNDLLGVDDYLIASLTGGYYPPSEWDLDSLFLGGGPGASGGYSWPGLEFGGGYSDWGYSWPGLDFGGGYSYPLSQDAMDMISNYYAWSAGQFESLYDSAQSFNDWMASSWSSALGGDWP